MRSVNERFKEYLEFKNIDAPAHYKAINISKELWSNYKEGERAIPLNRVCDIVQYFKDLNSRWLLTGEGSMIETNYQQHDNRYSANDSPQPPPITQRRCSDPGCNAELVKLNDEIVRYKLIIDQLINRADMLRRDDPPEKYVTGGVAKSGQKSQNKKAG